MKRLFLDEILLVSPREKRAKKVKFHPKTTVILGGNDTGKSCLVKSIYWTFGAEVQFDDAWQNAQVASLVRFRLNEERYSILRCMKTYAIFDKDDNCLLNGSSVTNDLGPFFADMFNFGIKLNSQNNEIKNLPPAYFFLPFYIDQDKGWSGNWNSFRNLQQFLNWKRPLVEFHTGIYPSEYYVAKTEIEVLKPELDKLQTELEIVQRVAEKITDRYKKEILFDVSIENFKEEIEKLLQQCSILKKEEDTIRLKLSALYNKKSTYVEQIDVVRRAMSEFRKDFDYANDVLESETVDCPTCGQTYDNSFTNRFSIAKDEGRCFEYLIELEKQLKNVEEELDGQKMSYDNKYENVAQIRTLLETKKEEVKLKHLIEAEGKKEVKQDLNEEIENLYSEISKINLKVDDKRKEASIYDDKKRKEEINQYYFSHLQKYILDLDIHRLSGKKYEKILCNIIEQGSDLPRAILAYFYSVLHTINKYSSSTFAPIVIDEPNQQGQDDINLPKLLEFINREKPNEAQLILGVESLKNVEFEGARIEVKTKWQLLDDKEYHQVWKEIQPYLDKSIGKVDKD